IGASYDDGKLLVQGEYVLRRTSGGGMLDMTGYYATAGYRLGPYTPYVIASRYQFKGTILPNQSGRRTLAAGVRWDAIKDVAFKLQLESVQNNGLNFVNASPAFNVGDRKVNVVTLLADFVF
ncbi:MAG: hypothetical protein JWQ11_1082, partial [Rhizobacter sp.]|nr:hypothetical protein [Rhizobacter sp.]